jgi:demethylmenaquinone methyltransferase/2-methoxy-6-polyprenyl-1,4-benzoquinol methylase
MSQKDPQVISSMFDQVSSGYDRTNSLISFGLLGGWRKQVMAALDVPKREWVLDFAAGTGASTLPLLAKGWHAVAVDFSLGMLTQGRKTRPGVPFIAGDGAALPFRSGVFAGVTVSFGIRNCQDTKAVLAELLRVTRPGGRMVICEFSHPTNRTWNALYQKTLSSWLPKLARANGADENAYRYLVESIEGWYDQPSLAEIIRETGWQSVDWRNLSGGALAIHRATK